MCAALSSCPLSRSLLHLSPRTQAARPASPPPPAAPSARCELLARRRARAHGRGCPCVCPPPQALAPCPPRHRRAHPAPPPLPPAPPPAARCSHVFAREGAPCLCAALAVCLVPYWRLLFAAACSSATARAPCSPLPSPAPPPACCEVLMRRRARAPWGGRPVCVCAPFPRCFLPPRHRMRSAAARAPAPLPPPAAPPYTARCSHVVARVSGCVVLRPFPSCPASLLQLHAPCSPCCPWPAAGSWSCARLRSFCVASENLALPELMDLR